MFCRIILTAVILFVLGCTDAPRELTPQMKEMATKTVVDYLKRNNLPNENLVASVSQNRNIADFSFLYTGAGRCINFIVKCYGNSCNDLQKYPYDEHGEKCP